jgi:hypothetical protein
MSNDFMKMKRKLIREIKRLIRPLLYDSGYRKALDPKQGILGPSRAWKVWRPGDNTPFKLRGGYKLTEFFAFYEDGMITDAYGGGAVFEAYEDFPVEDLHRLRSWVLRKLGRD